MCFPQKDLKWKKNVLRECYINLGINLFEFLYFPKLNKESVKRFFYFDNEEFVDKTVKLGKGVFFLSGHFSNWEMTAFGYPLISGRRLNVIAKIQSSKLLNNRINQYRELSGNEIIEISASIREVYSKIKNKEIVCFLVDQSAHPDYSVYVDFFGKNVATFKGPAKMALKFKVELVLGYVIRTEDYNYEVQIEKIEYSDLEECNEENTKELTQRIQKALESIIIQHPGQWLWLHKRFKHMKEKV